ncbi:facilitated trehalose transporter Tret1 isoform X2 [Cephus cinctus]|uniref:Facilitated trehalose transporter Tret1 isoform X2 n=1 Tax=Cephus cinctus TaxID=211228 RepID=A0AAJ7REZ4_CEPCN|nr:facilitated trehalose transporter Tret1 isoform X2 [Cephus cinctus]
MATQFIITGSFVGGFAVGIFLITATLFVSEISLPENRGTVATMTSLSGYFGIFIICYLGIHVDLQILAPGIIGFTIFFIISTSLWMNESPYYLYKCGRVLDAKLSLMTLRGKTTILEIDEEHKSMVQFFNSEIEYPTRVKRMINLMFGSGKMEMSMMFLLLTLCTTQVIGGYAMTNYVDSIVSTQLPRYGTVFLALMNFVSVVCCLGTIEKIGRKFILKLSCIGSSTCYLIIFIYNFYYGTKCEPGNGTATSLIIIIAIYYIIYTFGVIPVIPVLTSEIFPNKIKTVAIGFCFSSVYLANLIIAWLYFSLSHLMGVCPTFAVFTFTGAIGLPVIIWSLPETNGKSLYEIQHELRDEIIDPVIPSY